MKYNVMCRHGTTHISPTTQSHHITYPTKTNILKKTTFLIGLPYKPTIVTCHRRHGVAPSGIMACSSIMNQFLTGCWSIGTRNTENQVKTPWTVHRYIDQYALNKVPFPAEVTLSSSYSPEISPFLRSVSGRGKGYLCSDVFAKS